MFHCQILFVKYVLNVYLICLVEQLSSLAVTEDSPGYVTLFQLGGADFAGIRAVRLVEDILCGDFNTRAKVFACQEKVECRRRDDDL